MARSYSKTTWVNGQAPAINATNLNKMEQGIYDASQMIPDTDEFVEHKKLLWTNASPTSEFAAQTISLDLSDYDEVEIQTNLTNTVGNQCFNKVAVGQGEFIERFYNGTSSANYLSLMHRSVSVSTAGAVFDDSYTKLSNSTSSSVNNARLIPYRIYGIKRIGA